MAFPPDLPRFLRRRWRRRSRGSALVQALMAALIALIGLLVLASRLFSSRFNSFSRSDTLAAREAAEFGLNELQAQLNSNQYSYLWVTRRSSWGSGNLRSALTTCNVPALDSSGAPLTALPALPDGITTAKTITTVNGATISYRLRSNDANDGFQPPELPDQNANTVNQPAFCNAGADSAANSAAATNFGNLNGGSAIITVVGTVSRGSGTSATETKFALSRKVYVRPPGGAAQDLYLSFVILGDAYNATCKYNDGSGKSKDISGCTADPTPIAPPIFGSFSDITRLSRANGDICYGGPSGCFSPLQPTVIGCADLDACIVNNLDTVSNKNRDRFCRQKAKNLKSKKKSFACNSFQQTFVPDLSRTDPRTSALTVTDAQWAILARDMTCDTKAGAITCKNNNNADVASAFPYATASVPSSVSNGTNAGLVQGCYFNSTITSGLTSAPTSAVNNGSTAISCFFRGQEDKGNVAAFIGGNKDLVVHTGPLPVNIFLYDVVRGGKRQAYDLEGAGIVNSNPQDWFRLRILGEPTIAPASASDAVSCDRTRLIATKDNNINGAFIWLPNGRLEYSKKDSKDTSYNVIWTCQFTPPAKDKERFTIITPPESDPTVGVRDKINTIIPSFSTSPVIGTSGGSGASVYRGYGSEDSPASL